MTITSRRKGARVETEIVNRHLGLGVKAEKYPLSGATHYRGSGHDIDVYAFGEEAAPLVAEVKARKAGKGFTQLERWLDEYDLLFLRKDGEPPLVMMPWRVWQLILERTCLDSFHRGAARRSGTSAKPAPQDADEKAETDGE